jgi:hypothetical protein
LPGLTRIAGGPTELDAGLLPQHAREPLPNQRLFVDQYNPHVPSFLSRSLLAYKSRARAVIAARAGIWAAFRRLARGDPPYPWQLAAGRRDWVNDLIEAGLVQSRWRLNL